MKSIKLNDSIFLFFLLTFFDFLTVIQVQSPIRKSPQQIQVFMFKVIWLPTFHSLNAQTHQICTDASTVIIYRLVSVHDQIKCLITNINMTFELTVAPCCVKSPWWYYLISLHLYFLICRCFTHLLLGYFFVKLSKSFISKTCGTQFKI